MHPLRPDIRIIATISGIVFLTLFCVWLWISGVEGDRIITAASKSGAILTFLGLFWAFYIKIGWRLNLFRLWGYLSNVPDLRGRWEGTVCRNRGDTPHPFVIEISQTFTSISYRAFSKNSKGESVTASIFADETGQVFYIISTWRTVSRKLNDRASEEEFSGTSRWNVSINSEKKLIEDNYYTKREPQTKGIVCVEWKGLELLNKFE